MMPYKLLSKMTLVARKFLDYALHNMSTAQENQIIQSSIHFKNELNLFLDETEFISK